MVNLWSGTRIAVGKASETPLKEVIRCDFGAMKLEYQSVRQKAWSPVSLHSGAAILLQHLGSSMSGLEGIGTRAWHRSRR